MILSLLLIFSNLSFALPPSVSQSGFLIEEKMDFRKSNSLGVSRDKKNKPSSLKVLKDLEQSKKWKECQELAPAVVKEFPTVKPWVLRAWAVCAARAFKVSSLPKAALLNPYNVFEKNQIIVESSIAWKSTRLEMQNLLALYIEAVLKDNARAGAKLLGPWIHKYYELSLEDKVSKARALAWSADISMINHQLVAAESFYEQSLHLTDNAEVREKLNSVRLALNIKKEEPVTSKVEILSEAEQKFEERFKATLKNNDLVAFVDDAITYLNRFPNGRRAKWCFEKIQDIYQNFSDKSDDGNSDEKFSILKQKTLEQFEKLEATRLLEIARNLHRRGDFAAGLRLAEKSYGPLSQSPQSGLILYIMGRCAQLSGEYKKARKYFEQYIEYQSSGDEIGEVQFRLALTHYRLGEYSSVVAVLERLMVNKTGDRYDLLSRYWLVRALQALSNSRAEIEAKILIEKYPLSYYGLRLQAERQNQSLGPWPTIGAKSKLSSSIFWTSFQKSAWDRVLLLGQNDWIGEALSEVSEMTLSAQPEAKTLLAQKLVQNHIYSPAIKLISDSLDQNPDLQSLEVISLGFPDAYADAISTQAQKYLLSPLLVKSLIRQESAFNEKATSSSKAMGLMQLIPPTAQEVATDLGLQGLELPQDAYLPGVNLQMGTSYIARMIKQFGGSVPLGLAAYNAGPSKVSSFIRARPEVRELTNRRSSEPIDEIWIDELPWTETSFYVKAILRNTILYRLRSGDKITLPQVLWSDLRLAP
jgi:soluble lytic murein transglycosylase